ncbi:hypothetical protein RRG08_019971 [Elysia crispata]|uniref:Uncharacterized protein n=1 Tax=Elysia crispata TaxID=231223 RepID=A0AAE1D5A2_9GAST|nr:hypothetical protein RRG08_019971 [Elysia crispata]
MEVVTRSLTRTNHSYINRSLTVAGYLASESNLKISAGSDYNEKCEFQLEFDSRKDGDLLNIQASVWLRCLWHEMILQTLSTSSAAYKDKM